MHALGVRVRRRVLCERWEEEGAGRAGGEGDKDAFGGRAGGSGREVRVSRSVCVYLDAQPVTECAASLLKKFKTHKDTHTHPNIQTHT
jgi:hypothetical protein